MEKRVLWLLIGLVIGAAAVWYAIPKLSNLDVSQEKTVSPATQESSNGAELTPQPAAVGGPTLAVSDASLNQGATPGKTAQPAKADDTTANPPEIPAGTVALFYRASFGSDTQNLKTVITDTSGEGNGGVADISWTTGSKGIVRYIPETGQTDVIKTIVSTSYSKSSIYPITVGDRLFAVRDWGSDWTGGDKRLTVEELDPSSGATLSSTDVTAEWFTILNDQLYFQSEVTEDFWTGQRSGGTLKVKTLGNLDEQDFPVEDARLYGVGGNLVSVGEQEIRWRRPSDGAVESIIHVPSLSLAEVWPDSRHIFSGDQSILWAWSEPGVPQIIIIRTAVDGNLELLTPFDLEGGETGLVLDEDQGRVLVGVAGSVPPRGMGITQIFLINTSDGSVKEYPVDGFIPSAQPDAGGGLQILVMP